jgi:hypothetical protein
MDGYCGACGVRAPGKDVGKDAARLVLKGWRVRQSVPLERREPRHWILLCPACLADPSSSAKRLLEVWGRRRRKA